MEVYVPAKFLDITIYNKKGRWQNFLANPRIKAYYSQNTLICEWYIYNHFINYERFNTWLTFRGNNPLYYQSLSKLKDFEYINKAIVIYLEFGDNGLCNLFLKHLLLGGRI